MKKALIAYFSCTGTTEKLAKGIATAVKGDLYKITPLVPYTKADLNWNDKNSRSSIEMRNKSSRPEIIGKLATLAIYDVIFIGFPIWWYLPPTIINTFIESYDFSYKTVIPFATSGGSGVGECDKFLQNSCSLSTNWRPARRFDKNTHVEELKVWIESLKL